MYVVHFQNEGYNQLIFQLENEHFLLHKQYGNIWKGKRYFDSFLLVKLGHLCLVTNTLKLLCFGKKRLDFFWWRNWIFWVWRKDGWYKDFISKIITFSLKARDNLTLSKCFACWALTPPPSPRFDFLWRLVHGVFLFLMLIKRFEKKNNRMGGWDWMLYKKRQSKDNSYEYISFLVFRISHFAFDDEYTDTTLRVITVEKKQ